MMYFPARASEETPAAAALAFRELKLATEDGERLHGWWVRASGPPAGHVLLCHGNAGNIADRLPRCYRRRDSTCCCSTIAATAAAAGAPASTGPPATPPP